MVQISDVKDIPLDLFALHLGGNYSHTDRNGDQWYFSPFRPDEKTASFKINHRTNKWFDFGHAARTSSGNGSGGDVFDLWCDYHGKDRRTNFKEALHALQAFKGSPAASYRRIKSPSSAVRNHEPNDTKAGVGRFKILKLHNRFFYPSVLAELEKRRITSALAEFYLQQVWLQDTAQPDRKQNGFAFANDKGGHEISIPNPDKGTTFKTSTRPKSLTSFKVRYSTKLFVFEGFWDFLSWLEMQDTPQPEHSVIVLNSLSFCGEVVANLTAARTREIEREKEAVQLLSEGQELLQRHRDAKAECIDTVMLFLDNDDAGIKASHFMSDELNALGFTVRPMESLYKNYKDLSDYWAKDPDAKKITEQKAAEVKYYTGDSATATVMNRTKDPRPR